MASGDTLCIFLPGHNEPPSSNYATKGTRNQHRILKFAASPNQSAVFSAVMPRHYSGGSIIPYYHVSSTGTSNAFDIDGAFEKIGDGSQDVDSDGFASAKSSDGNTVPATSGNVDIITGPTFSSSEADSIAAGEKFRFKITRDASSDSSSDVMELHAIELKEA